MDLYIIRHAWAEQRDFDRWPDDSKRPLTPLGIKRFRKLLKTIRPREFDVSLIATSPYIRCAQTALLTSEAFKPARPVEPIEALEPGSDLATLVEWTNHRVSEGHTALAWVGHAPDVDELTGRLIGNGSAFLRFAKGAIALVRFDEPITPGEGELRWLVTAKVLGV